MDLALTKEKMSQRDLESSKFIEIVLQNIPLMIFVKNFKNDLRYSLLNKAGQVIFGASEKDVIGKNDYVFYPKEQSDFFISKNKTVFESRGLGKIQCVGLISSMFRF